MSETIAFRVPSEKKKEWQDAVKSSEEYDSLTHLIRLSVERELSDASRAPQSGTQPAASAQEMGKLSDQIDSLSDRLAVVQDDVSRVLERSHAVGGIPDNEVIEDVFATLETGDLRDRLHTDEIAERVDHDPVVVEIALEKLNEEMTSVEKEPMPDGDHWFRRE